jgi:cellulose synthase/poly-beta-1,6-N-acetylglucosamine synthase-like glycosyltransferase
MKLSEFIINPFIEVLILLKSLSIWEFIKMFWGFIFIDVPRYLIDDLGVLIQETFKRDNAKKEEFLKHLQHIRPLISVIIPAFNEEEGILKTIKSLKEQTYPDIEIIVVDDGSTDRTAQLCQHLQKRGEIKFLRNEVRGGKSSAINLGFNYSLGDYIVIVDSDTTFDRDALKNILKHFYNPNIDAVSGNILVRNKNKSLLTKIQAIEYLISLSLGRRFASWIGILPIASGAFSAFRRNAYSRVGGSDVGPGEDLDISLKVKKTGYRIGFASDAIALTDVPETLGSLIKQRLRWERDIIKLVIRKHINNFNPFWSGFRFINMLSSAEILFYTVVFTVPFFFYLISIYIFFRQKFVVILFTVYLLYFTMDLIQFFISWGFTRKKRENISLLIYLPLFSLYMGYFNRLIRMIAYLDEFFFRRSYKDPYIPEKVARKTKIW